VVVQSVITRDQFTEPQKQMLQPQVRTDSFVKGVFVKDHADFPRGQMLMG